MVEKNNKIIRNNFKILWKKLKIINKEKHIKKIKNTDKNMSKLAIFFEVKSLKRKVIKNANKKQKIMSFLKFLNVNFVFFDVRISYFNKKQMLLFI